MTSKEGFKRAAEIRRGEHDRELPDFDVICSWIHRCPLTWLGGLLATTAARCATEPFFANDEAMMGFILRAIAVARYQPSVLREESQAMPPPNHCRCGLCGRIYPAGGPHRCEDQDTTT